MESPHRDGEMHLPTILVNYEGNMESIAQAVAVQKTLRKVIDCMHIETSKFDSPQHSALR